MSSAATLGRSGGWTTSASGAGWRCREVGAGGGSITRWLCGRAGPEGRVLATDLDTRFVEKLDDENLDVRRMVLRTDGLPADAFDLVHARAVLMHIPKREHILDALLAALRPGGEIPLLEGGSAGAESWQVSMSQLWERGLVAGSPPAGLTNGTPC